jgi:hypothetical protein
MIAILGESGIGSANAMILNLFKESTMPLIVTADKSVRNTMLNSSFGGKFVRAIFYNPLLLKWNLWPQHSYKCCSPKKFTYFAFSAPL